MQSMEMVTKIFPSASNTSKSITKLHTNNERGNIVSTDNGVERFHKVIPYDFIKYL